MVRFAIEQNTTTRETIIFNHTPPMNFGMDTNDSGCPENVPPQLSFEGGTFGATAEAAPTAEEEVRSLPMRAMRPGVPRPWGVGEAARARGAGSYAHLPPAHTARTPTPSAQPNAPTPPNFAWF